MRSLDFGSCALGISVAAAMLTGCAGSQPPIGAPGAMVQTSAIATHTDRGTSWIKSKASSGDLLYVSQELGSVSIFSYPKGELVGSFSGFQLLP